MHYPNAEYTPVVFEPHFYPSDFNPKNVTTASPSVNSQSFPDGVPFFFPQYFQILAHIFYNIILLLGLVGNGCVLLIFAIQRPQFRKLPTPLLANLAIGDLLITFFCLETSYITILWQYWPFGKFLCYALSPVKPIAVFVSSYTLIALSLDRYLSVVRDPMRRSGVILAREKVKWTVGAIWVCAFITSIPVGLFTSYEIHELTGHPRCGEYTWESEINEMIYDIALITLQFVAPLLVLGYTYTKISIVVFNNRALRNRLSNGTSPRNKSLKTVRMSLIIVGGYVFAWLPYNCAFLLSQYSRGLADSDHFPYIFIACHWLAMSHSVFNPIIYFWLNDSFRSTVLGFFCKTISRNMERRRYSSTHYSWRNSTLITSNGRSSLPRTSSRSKQSPETPTTEFSPSYPVSSTLKLDLQGISSKSTIKREEATLINGIS